MKIELGESSIGIETACLRKPGYDPFWLTRFAVTELHPMSKTVTDYLKGLPRRAKRRAELDYLSAILENNLRGRIVCINSKWS